MARLVGYAGIRTECDGYYTNGTCTYFDSNKVYCVDIGGYRFYSSVTNNIAGNQVTNNTLLYKNYTISSYGGRNYGSGTAYRAYVYNVDETYYVYDYYFSKGTGISSISKSSWTGQSSGSYTTCTASVSSGYLFDGWYLNNSRVTTSTTLTITAGSSGEGTYQARATYNMATITVGKQGNGTVSGGGTYTIGSSITISAAGASASGGTGSRFLRWSDGNTQASRTITVPAGGATYTAVFTTTYLVNTLSNSEVDVALSVSGSGDWRTSVVVDSGTTITLKTTFKDPTKHELIHWNLNNSKIQGSDRQLQITATVTTASTYGIAYQERLYIVAVDPQCLNMGTVGIYDENDNNIGVSANPYGHQWLTMRCAPSPSESVVYAFDGWYVSGSKVSSLQDYRVEYNSNYTRTTFYAKFKLANSYPIALAARTATGSGGGTLRIESGISAGGSEYYEGAIRITALPDTGYAISSWVLDYDANDPNAGTEFKIKDVVEGSSSTETFQGETLTYILDGYKDASNQTPHTITCFFGRFRLGVSVEDNSPSSGDPYGISVIKAHDGSAWNNYNSAGEYAGTPLSVIATASAPGTILVRATLKIGDAQPIDVTSDFTASTASATIDGESVEVNEYTYGGGTGNDDGLKTVRGRMLFTLYWGGTVSVVRKVHAVSTGQTSDSASTGDFFVEANENDAMAHTLLSVTYGDDAWLMATGPLKYIAPTEADGDTPANPGSGEVFVGWFDLAADPRLEHPLDGAAGDQRIVNVTSTAANATYCALFADGTWWKYVRLYCDPDAQYASVALEAAHPDGSGEEWRLQAMESGSDYNDLVEDALDLPIETLDPIYVSQGPGRAGQSASGTPDVPIFDSWWKVIAGTQVRITATTIDNDKRFLQWTRQDHYKTTQEIREGDENDYVVQRTVTNYVKTEQAPLATANPATFAVAAHSEIMASVADIGWLWCVVSVSQHANNGSAGVCSAYLRSATGGEERIERNSFFKQVWSGSEATAVAVAASGFLFAGWFDADDAGANKLSDNQEFTFVANTPTTLYAKFDRDSSAVFLWEGGSENKTMIWRSRRFASAQPTNLSAVAIHADGYPEEDPPLVAVFYASSPDGDARMATTEPIPIESQDARRLPQLRPEKYVEIEVTSSQPVLRVAASTSMAGLNG